MTSFQETIQNAAAQISRYLEEHGQATSWQLKIKFHLSGSVLYLALGQLTAQNKITLEADGINYNVTWGQKSADALAAAAPFQANM